MKLWQAYLLGVAMQFVLTCCFRWLDREITRRNFEARKHINGGEEDV